LSKERGAKGVDGSLCRGTLEREREFELRGIVRVRERVILMGFCSMDVCEEKREENREKQEKGEREKKRRGEEKKRKGKRKEEKGEKKERKRRRKTKRSKQGKTVL